MAFSSGVVVILSIITASLLVSSQVHAQVETAQSPEENSQATPDPGDDCSMSYGLTKHRKIGRCVWAKKGQ